jgi:hypothetical protein
VSDKLCNLLKRRPLSFMMPSDNEVSLPKNSTMGWPVSTVARNCSTVMDQCGSGPQPGFPFRSGDYDKKVTQNILYSVMFYHREHRWKLQHLKTWVIILCNLKEYFTSLYKYTSFITDIDKLHFVETPNLIQTFLIIQLCLLQEKFHLYCVSHGFNVDLKVNI